MKKSKLILYISFIPYVFLILNFLFSAINGYGFNMGAKSYFLRAISNWIGDNLDKLLFLELNFYNITLAICLTYQITYFIYNSVNNKKVLDIKSKEEKRTIDFSKIIFILTLIFWVGVVIFTIYSMIYGIEKIVIICFLDCSREIVYGINAIKEILVLLILFSIIPIIPIIVMFDIIYIIIRKKKGIKLLKK